MKQNQKLTFLKLQLIYGILVLTFACSWQEEFFKLQ